MPAWHRTAITAAALAAALLTAAAPANAQTDARPDAIVTFTYTGIGATHADASSAALAGLESEESGLESYGGTCGDPEVVGYGQKANGNWWVELSATCVLVPRTPPQ